MRRLLCATAMLVLVMPVQAGRSVSQAPPAAAAPVIVFTTAKGVIEVEMFPGDAPKSVARVVELAKQGFYRGTRFHWVQPVVVQFGDQLSRDMSKKDQWGKGGSGPARSARPIGVAEISKRQFVRGIVGLAYQAWQDPASADCQLFIVKAANPALNGKYAAIGRVTKGMEVVDKIEVEDMIKDVTVR